MEKNSRNYNNISVIFYRIITKFYNLEKKARDFGTKEKLYPAEIHMVQAIGRNKGVNVTELADILGITKGAVPKKIQKLRSKGLVKRYQKEGNRKEVCFTLTAMGEIAYQKHEDFHKQMDRDLMKLYNTLNRMDMALITEFLFELENFVDRALKK